MKASGNCFQMVSKEPNNSQLNNPPGMLLSRAILMSCLHGAARDSPLDLEFQALLPRGISDSGA